MEYKIMATRELEWFDLETRMRELIHQQLAPIMIKSREDQDQWVMTKALCSKLESRLSKIETMVFGDQGQETVIQEIFAKYAETEGNRKRDIVRIDQEVSFVNENLKSLNFCIAKMDENTQNLNRFVKELDTEITNTRITVEHNKESIMKELDNVGRNFRELNATYTAITLKAEEKALTAFDKTKAITLEIGLFKRELESIWKSHNEMILLARDSKANKLDTDEFHNQMDILESRFKSMQDIINKYKDEFFHRDVYFEKYYPLKVAGMISNFLHYSLDLENLTKLAEYENYIFPEMNKETLSYTSTPRDELVKNILEQIRVVEERKTKLLRISPGKKEGKAKKSTAVENIESIHVENSTSPANPPKDIFSSLFNQGFEDNIIEKIAIKIEVDLKKIKNEVEAKFDVVTQSFKSKSDQNSLLIKQVLYELTDIVNDRKKDKAELEKELEKIKKTLQDNDLMLNSHKDLLEKLSKMLVCVVETVQIQQALDAQDEEDRHNMAQTIDRDLQNELVLSGAPENYNSTVPSAVFSVKKNCLSCGTATSMLSGIRTSVVYHPTPLFYRAKMYQRPELIAVKGRILKTCWDAYEIPFKPDEIEPIFAKASHTSRIIATGETERNEVEREVSSLNLSSFRNKSGNKSNFRIRSYMRSSDRASF